MNCDFELDSRLPFASTPSARWYFDSDLYRFERRRVFPATWQLVGRADQVAQAGQYFTATIADEPIIVARGLDMTLRAFSNVCRHRAGPVPTGPGQCRTFRCGYHGWTYALEGRLAATPEFDCVEDCEKT